MLHAPPDFTLTVALIAGSGVLAQWLAWRLRFPSIILMMGAGLLLGPIWTLMSGAPLLEPAETFGGYLRPMIALAVAIILFEGGMTLNLRDLRETSQPVRRMVFISLPIAWLLGTLALYFVARIELSLAIMIGGLMTVTGPTVVLPLLRQAKLPHRVASVLKWEGIVNDPIGALIAVFAFEVIHQNALGQSFAGAVFALVVGAIIGAALGFAFGYGLSYAFRRGWVSEPLKSPLIMGAVLVCFALAEELAAETGLVAVTLFGLVLANARLASIDEMRRFKEGLAAILVASVFVVLAADLSIDDVTALKWYHLAFVLVFMLLVRPVAVFLATLGSGLNWREMAFIGFIGPRGVVAAATAGHLGAELVDVGREETSILAPLVFATVFASVFMAGLAAGPLARLLRLTETGPDRMLIVGANPWSLGLAEALKKADIAVTIADTSWRRLREARLAGHSVFYGEVLSEDAEWRLEPSRFAALLATTSNDAYNALVCVDYAPELGRSHVFQLSAFDAANGSDPAKDDKRAISYTARGRTLIRRGRSYDSLARDWWLGWTFKATRLSEEYPLERFLEESGDNADLILARSAKGQVTLLGSGVDIPDAPGTVIVRFAPPEQTRTARQRTDRKARAEREERAEEGFSEDEAKSD
ncbi:cation:proton antiporter [Maricaulis sp. CAU 1757]